MRWSPWILAVCMLVAALGCSDDDDKGPTEPGDPEGYVNADGFNGGQMYDKFWASETGWDQSDPNLSTFNDHKDFFRCKQCHGWDRLGSQGAYIGRAPKTSRPNVSSLNLKTNADTKTPQELFDALKSSTGRRSVDADLSTYDPDTNPTVGDQMPDYGSIFTDAQLWDLVKFLKENATDTAELYDSQTSGSYPTGSITFSNIGKDGNASDGDALFASKCAVCHGADGTEFLVDGEEYTVGSFVRGKPNEGQHKVKFGQLGTAMGSLLTDVDDIKDVYKALTDATKYPDPTPGDPDGYVNADGLNGGQMYDKFWASETGWDENDPNLTTFNDYKNFFRCKQCHGWDRLGNQGAYIGRAPSTSRPNVSALNLKTIADGMTAQELFDALKSSTGRRSVGAELSDYDPDTNPSVGDQMPDYGSFFTDAQLWDVVKFLKEEAIDTADLYDSETSGTYPDGSITFSNIGKDGDASNGDALFAANCAVCHGADGTEFLVDGEEYTVGSHVRGKPNEDQHKVKFGQLGTLMINILTDVDDIKDVYKALTDETKYPDPNVP